MTITLRRLELSGFRHACKVCGCIFPLILVSSASAKTIEDIEKELVQKYEKIRSYTAKTESKQDMDLGQGNKVKSESKGTIEWMRKGKKGLYRLEMKGSSVSTFSGEETKSKSASTIVCDEQFIYTLNDTNGQKMATKSKADPNQSHDPGSMFKIWRKDYDLKLLSDEKFDDKDCYVIEATPKKKNPDNPLVQSKFWLRKDSGILVKILMLDKDNKPAQISTTTDIKIDAEIKPERFKFEVPEGVQLIDMTQTQNQSNGSNKQNDTELESTKEESAKEKEQKPVEKKKEKSLLDKLLK